MSQTENNMQELRKKIWYLMEKKDISINQLAAKLNRTQQFTSMIVKGASRKTLRMSTVESIADALGVPLCELFIHIPIGAEVSAPDARFKKKKI